MNLEGSMRDTTASRSKVIPHVPARATAIVILCVLFLLPLVFMVLGSLRQPGLPPPDGFEWVPETFDVSNYATVQHIVPLVAQVRNSLVVVALAVPVTVLVASWAGFAIATARPRTQLRLIVLSLIVLMIPLSALWVPRFVMFRWLGLIDTPWSLMAPAVMGTSPFYVLLFALAYARIPKALYEAARLERLSPLATWWRVALPLTRPATFTVAILAFVFHWSNFMDPLLYLFSEDRYTAPLGLRALQTLEAANHPLLLAGSVIVTLPAVIAFLGVQRAFFTKTLRA